MKILCISHSSRQFFEARCLPNALEERFRDRRLAELPAFETLPGLDAAIPYDGALTLWELVGEDTDRPELLFLRCFDPGYKVQSAAFTGDSLLVYGSDRLEVLDRDFRVVKTITDPWMAGGHMVYPADGNRAWVTAAVANAVMLIDLENGRVEERRSMPDRYGKGYALTPCHDLRKHAIPTDLQPTHVNSAVPCGTMLLVTLFIPGAIGFLGPDGDWREVVSGFRGCHGARPCGDGTVMLTDSATGIVWFIDAETGAIRGRIDLESQWVHDAAPVSRRLVVAAIGDRNEIRLVDRTNNSTLFSRPCDEFGATVMFVNSFDLDPDWRPALEKTDPRPTRDEVASIQFSDRNVAPSFIRYAVPGVDDLAAAVRISSAGTVKYDYLLSSPPFSLNPGRYLLEAAADCRVGGISVGIHKSPGLAWLAAVPLDKVARRGENTFEVQSRIDAMITVAANNPLVPGPVDAILEQVKLRPSADDPEIWKCADHVPASTGRPADPDALLPNNVIACQWRSSIDDARGVMRVISNKPLRYEYLLSALVPKAGAGKYELRSEVELRAGSVSVGVLDRPATDSKGEFLVQNHHRSSGVIEKIFTVTRRGTLGLVITANNPGNPGMVDAVVRDLSIRKHQN